MSTEPIVLSATGSSQRERTKLIRERGPVTRVALPGGVLAWSVTGYAEARAIAADPRVSRNAHEHWPAYREGRIPADWPLITWVAPRSVANAHGPEHARLRGLLATSLTAGRVQLLRPVVEKITHELLDELERTTPRGEVVDLRERYAHPLSGRVVGYLLGVPEELRQEADRLIQLLAYPAQAPTDGAALAAEWQAMAGRLVADKRANPGDDVTTALITARDGDGGLLDEDELRSTILTLLRAGHITVLELVTNAVADLLTHPDQLALVRQGQVGWSEVVEEALRASGPVEHMPLRYAIEDIEVGDVVIPAGDPIVIAFGAAGRDPAVHGATAEDFDVTRADKRHLAFGHGAHYCVGAPLGRLEAGTALPALFERFPDLSLAVPADGLEPVPTFLMNGYRALPVRLTS